MIARIHITVPGYSALNEEECENQKELAISSKTCGETEGEPLATLPVEEKPTLHTLEKRD